MQEKHLHKKSFKEYITMSHFSFLLKQMHKYPFSYLLYAIPSILVILLITELLSFYSFIQYGFTQVQNEAELVNTVSTFFSMIGLYLISYYILDTFVAIFSYTQYRLGKPIIQTFKEAFKRYPKYLLHRVLQLLIIFSPLIVGVIIIVLFSYIAQFLLQAPQPSTFAVLFIVFCMLIILGVSFAISLFLSFRYTYLAVSTQFSSSNKLFLVKEFNTKTKGKFRTLFFRVLVLFGIILSFQLLQSVYDVLVSFIPISTLVLLFQIIGVLISMFIFYFINTYLFFTFKEEFESKGNNASSIKNKK
ncbi:MAG: hypothetical protein LAT82_01380 [Nanoarchaeota archaeon]|nr:hypothetical protein [Nanoarchaeota archaeon]